MVEFSKKQFLNMKKQSLEKLDKSPKGNIDEKILFLCNLINARDDMYTLSSCSGRICFLKRENGKKHTSWPIITHNLATTEQFYNIYKNFSQKELKQIQFRCEAVILHIAVENLSLAQKLINIAKNCGFNQCGIISIRKIVVEIICDADIICPAENLTKEYLTTLIKKSNENLQISWDAIKNLEQKIRKFN